MPNDLLAKLTGNSQNQPDPIAQIDQGNNPQSNLLARLTAGGPATPQQPDVTANADAAKVLPVGATAFDKYGNPYFGEGISGILKRFHYSMTKDVKNVTDEEWKNLWERWTSSLQTGRQVRQQGGDPQQWNALKEQQGSLLLETVGKTVQDATQDGSKLSPVIKFIGATTSTVGDLFNIAAKTLERAMGASQGFSEAANTVDSPLPALDSKIGKAIENLPLFGLAYDFTRLALSSSDNKWDYTRQKIADGWDAGRILYSTVFDQQKKQEYINRLHAGEDPGLLALELENPIAEMIGQTLLDPLNIVGWVAKGAKVAKELAVAEDAVTASGLLKSEAGRVAFKAIQEAADDTSGARAFAELTAAQADAVAQVQKNSKLLNVGHSIESLTTTSRQNAIISKGKDLLGNMAMVLRNNGMNEEAIAEAVLNGVRSTSPNATEMQKGLAGLTHLPNANMWLSDDAIETFSVLNRMMTNADGVVDGGKLRGLLEVKNPTEFAKEVERLYQVATKSQYQDIGELENAAKLVKQAEKVGGEVTLETRQMADRYNDLPNYVKVFNRTNEAIKRVTNPINKLLFPLYFNLQGGVAFRNYLNNLEMALIDKGPSAWFREGKYWTVEKQGEFLKEVYGALPESADGFKSLVSAATDKPAWGFGKLMEKGEQQAATKIVAASVRDTMDKMLEKAMPNLSREIEAGNITQKQVDKFAQLVRRNNYNVQKAMEEFRGLYKYGAVEDWRNLDYVGKFERQSLEAFDLMDDIEELARRGADTPDEIEKVFAKLNNVIDSRSELAVHDPIGISPDHSAIESWGDLAQAVEDGHLSPDDHQWFTAVMEATEQARLEYQTLLDDVSLKAITSLQQEGRGAEAEHLGQELNRVRDTLRRSTPVTSKKAHELTQEAWRWTEEVKRMKKPRFEDLAGVWRRSGLAGEPPIDLTRKVLLQKIWDNRYERVTALWNSSFDAVVGESETVLKQLEGVVDATELKSMATRTRFMTKQAQAIRSGAFRNGALKVFAKEDLNALADMYGITTDEIVQAINNAKGTAYKSIDELETRDILKLINERKLPAKPGMVEPGLAVPPPHPMGTAPTAPRVWNESASGLKYVLDRTKNQMLERWGRLGNDRAVSPEMERILGQMGDTLSPRMDEAKVVAARIAKQQREFSLLNYGEKTYLDTALSHIYPFQFFYRRSYKNWIRRLAENPQLISGYARYKGTLEKVNKDLPDWYKQQLNINPLADGTIFGNDVSNVPLLGMMEGHPLYVNLESTFNPLYGLTGTDFYDKTKRANWLLATIDDMNKFGPTMYAPIQLGIAAILYNQGEKDVAARWGGRLIPETTQVKAISSLFGKPIELDPAVNFFSGGIDPMERGRMAYAAGQLVESGQYTAEEVMNALQQQSGPIWDTAYQMAVQSRSASAMTSYFFGVGFKPRSTNDVTVEEIYTDLNKIWAMSDMMTSEQYRTAQAQLRSKYPDGLVDAVLLSRSGGDKRDAALAYNVLSRIPPGYADDALKTIGLSQKEISKFHDSKGFSSQTVKFTPQEKQRFMAAILDLSVMLKIPDNTTRQEWTAAQNASSEMYKQLDEMFGADIQDKTQHYYALQENDREAAQAFAEQHPEIFQMMQYKRAAILSNPLLSTYYAGVDTVEKYIDGRIRDELSLKYGPDIYKVQTEFYNVDDQYAYKRQHPELQRFWNDKKALEKKYYPYLLSLAAKLPEKKPSLFQEGFTPQSPTQETLYNALQPQDKIPTWAEVTDGMPDYLKREIENHATNGVEISKRGQKELDFLAKSGGYKDADQLLLMAVLALGR